MLNASFAVQVLGERERARAREEFFDNQQGRGRGVSGLGFRVYKFSRAVENLLGTDYLTGHTQTSGDCECKVFT